MPVSHRVGNRFRRLRAICLALVVPLLGLWLRLPLERAFGFVLGSLLGLAAAGLLIALIGEK